MAMQEFGYTTSKGSNALPSNINIPVGGSNAAYLSQRSKAADDINSIMNSVLKVGEAVTQELQYSNKISQQEASKRLVDIKLQTQEDLLNVDKLDIAKIEAINEKYNSQTRSIIDGAELPDSYKVALDTAAMEYGGRVRESTYKMITEAKTTFLKEDVTNNMLMLHNSPLNDENTKAVFEDLKTRFRDLGVTPDAAEEFMASKYAETKLSTIDVNTLTGNDINKMINDSKEYIKSYINPKLIGKPITAEFVGKLEKLKDNVIREAQNVLSDYASNDSISLPTLKGMVQEEIKKGNLTNIEGANFIQAKQDRLEVLNTRAEAKRLANLNTQAKEVMYQIKNPEISIEEKAKLVENGIKNGLFSVNEGNYIMATQREEEAKLVNTNVVTQMKQDLEVAKMTMNVSPDEFDSLMLMTNKTLTEEDMNTAANYRNKYNIKNNIGTQISIFNTNKSDWIGKPGYNGFKEGVNDKSNEYYTNKFNPTAVVEIYNRHELKGNIENLVLKELSSPQSAVTAVNKFVQMNNIDPVATKAVVGDKNYFMLNALSNKVIADPRSPNKDKPDYIIPEATLDKIKDIAYNPKQKEISDDAKKYIAEKIKNNPLLFGKIDALETSAIIDGDNYKDAIDLLDEEIASKNIVPNFDVSKYPGKVNKEDKASMEYLVRVAQKDKYGVGIAYNPSDKFFYWSDTGSLYRDIITYTNPKNGAIRPITDLSELLYLYGKDKNEVTMKRIVN